MCKTYLSLSNSIVLFLRLLFMASVVTFLRPKTEVKVTSKTTLFLIFKTTP